MIENIFPQSQLPIRRTVDLLPLVFRTEANEKFLSGTLDPLVQPGALEKKVGYIGRRYGRTYNGNDVYLDSDQTLRSRYQLEPAVVVKKNNKIEKLYDYIDFKNQLRFFGNTSDRDDLITDQEHYSWAPPIDWDKFVNYREYYWVPDGPPPVSVLGATLDVVSKYKVRLGSGSVFNFTAQETASGAPVSTVAGYAAESGNTNNPTITLYRGQTYYFDVNVPDHGFAIRTSYDTGSLLYKETWPYTKGQLAVYDGKIWKAKTYISVSPNNLPPSESADWEYVELANQTTSLDYNKGVTNNGSVKNLITFKVPFDAPDVLFYQSLTDPNRFGKFIIADLSSNSKINVEREVVGLSEYTSSNGVKFTNGLVVRFEGQVEPSQFASGTWIVEGVGQSIKLINFETLIPPPVNTQAVEVLFDNAGFDAEPFDDAKFYPAAKDYIVINKASIDSNSWSRYNRWFHRNVLEYAHTFNGTTFDLSDDHRAKRPIIEFASDLKLYNHGAVALAPVDFVDTVTTDVFSLIEGSAGYIVDGRELYNGARLLVTADTDVMANNKIYEVAFIMHNGGTAVGVEWSPNEVYQPGERVRYLGQPFIAQDRLFPVTTSVISTSKLTNKFVADKQLGIQQGMAVSFIGPEYGPVEPNTVYYVIEVDNTRESTTEFKISETKGGPVFVPVNTAHSSGVMQAAFAFTPTDTVSWQVSFNQPQITLKQVETSNIDVGSCVLVKQGEKYSGSMFHYTGTEWKLSQQKISVNQPPKFDVFDNQGYSYGDTEIYPVSSFTGTEIVSYKVSSSGKDAELGFGVSYLNIDNIGDLAFEFDWDLDSFTYEIDKQIQSKKIAQGFYRFNNTAEYGNCWIVYQQEFSQPIVDSVVIKEANNRVMFDVDTIDWKSPTVDSLKIQLYINGKIYSDAYYRYTNVFEFPFGLNEGDVVSIKIYGDIEPVAGYYEIPLGLERNPLNQDITTFTLGQATDHVMSGVEMHEGFAGVYPGSSNLRDITGYQQLASRVLKHSGLSAISMMMLCDKQANIIKAIDYAKKSYRDFKNTFIKLASTLEYNLDPVEFVDDILSSMNAVKTQENAFADSDMVGTGACSVKTYRVEDTGISTFALDEKFSLNELSRRAVYVYINNQQLLSDRDYEFNENLGFVVIKKELNHGDLIEIKEYSSTSFSFIPPTPTKLGLFSKYTPEKFVDTTYVEPTLVIRGHDGSITVAYNDYRDDVLLELEKRIYNNLKQSYFKARTTIDDLFGGFYGNAVFEKSHLDTLMAGQFRRWAMESQVDYVDNSYFDPDNQFTFTYSKMSYSGSQYNLPGWWRGVYFWLYDTDRPHLAPWEMLGFSQQPDWWESQYGPAPYTSNNLILWEDIRNGIIRQGERAGQHLRYSRPDILNHLPVDDHGNLLDPLESGVAGDFSLINANGSFKYGDMSPAEYAWRRSSEWPFSMITACCLARPFEYISENLSRNDLAINQIGQVVTKDSGLFVKVQDIKYPAAGIQQTAGLINYVYDYVKHSGRSVKDLHDKIQGIDVNLSTRLSGFVDKSQQKYILESKNPRSKSSSVFIPDENYNVVFNTSVPIKTCSYSAVVVEKYNGGFRVYGYDTIDPVFRYYKLYPSQQDVLISIGGISENFVDWEPANVYVNGQIVRVHNVFYRALKTHTSAGIFEDTNWKRLPKLPEVGATSVLKRTHVNRQSVYELEYGSYFKDLQSLADFIFGYEQYLKDQGFEFNEYDPSSLSPRNWTASLKSLLFWSRHNWADGTLKSMSPLANKIVLNTPIGVAENFLDTFYEYSILQSDGTVLPVDYINVNRKLKKIEVETTENTRGMYLFKAFLVLKEHVTVFSDRTIFNDVIYDKPTGYRQERLKSRGFRTMDWDGNYTSPGFLYDDVNIVSWQPFVDYKLGDIVSYKSYNWTSLKNQQGQETFVDENWSRLDSEPTSQLVANFDFKVNQFEDYYNLDADGISQTQRDLARHAVGYQPREYLQDLAEDQVTQFKLYQGFIREKGTANAVAKVFDKLSRSQADSIDIKEEWAFRVGTLGGVDQVNSIEFLVSKDKFKLNPQPLVVVDSLIDPNTRDYLYRINQTSFTRSASPFTTRLVDTARFNGLTRSAGYVAETDIDVAVRTKNDILTLKIDQLRENACIWVTFDDNSWSVWKFKSSADHIILGVEKLNSVITIRFIKPHGLVTGDIFGIKNFDELTGFHQVIDYDQTWVKINSTADILTDFDYQSLIKNICTLTKVNFANFEEINRATFALSEPGTRLWIDDVLLSDNKTRGWQVIEKTLNYRVDDAGSVQARGITGLGSATVYVDRLQMIVAGAAESNAVMISTQAGSSYGVKQILIPEPGLASVSKKFGEHVAVSADTMWLAVSDPSASYVPSKFTGKFDNQQNYWYGDIVEFEGNLWQCLVNYTDVSSVGTPASSPANWVRTNILEANPVGYTGSNQQGYVALFKWGNGQWEYVTSIIGTASSERYGSSIAFTRANNKNYLFVGAPGADFEQGRVYVYVQTGSTWQFAETREYRGIFDSEVSYQYGDIVWYNNSYYKLLLQEHQGSFNELDWDVVTVVQPSYVLPSALASTGISDIEYGLNNGQLVEQITFGDKFGSSVTATTSGEMLFVGAPDSDNSKVQNYRGEWEEFQQYSTGDVVKITDLTSGVAKYYKLTDTRDDADPYTDSSVVFTTFENPTGVSVTNPWKPLSYQPELERSGKVFVYKFNGVGYTLSQTLTVDDVESAEPHKQGDRFGYNVRVSSNGQLLAVACPLADVNNSVQGVVYVFQLTEQGYVFKQQINSYESQPHEMFGSSLAISPEGNRVVVGAVNSRFIATQLFDNKTTTFDKSATRFVDNRGFAGQVYVYDLKDNTYYLSNKLFSIDTTDYAAFGKSVAISAHGVLVGAPGHAGYGRVQHFVDTEDSAWKILQEQEPLTDIDKIRNVALFDTNSQTKISDIEVLDYYKLRINGHAEQEIKYKTLYDPAIYTQGTSEHEVDENLAWYSRQVGALWWDLSTAKFFYAEQKDINYRLGHFNKLVPHASIDVYEWVESDVPPTSWAALADTATGIARGISGIPKHADDTVFSKKILVDKATGEPSKEVYYFWVKNKTTVPVGIPGRRISAEQVKNLILHPENSNVPYISFIAENQLLIQNLANIMAKDTAAINIEYLVDTASVNPVHKEYQLITEGLADNVPAASLEQKWVDSLVGYDEQGLKVPDEKLPFNQRYGVGFRPRQSMFVDRFQVVEAVIDYVNSILKQQPFTDLVDTTDLSSVDEIPEEVLGEYDIAVDTVTDLQNVNTSRLRPAKLTPVIVNGYVDSINIDDSGIGYRVPPPVVIQGNGVSARAECSIDNQGRIKQVKVLEKGRKYTFATATVRRYSVLVRNDATINNYWAIYHWDESSHSFVKRRTQTYNTPAYWHFVDWYASGVSSLTKVNGELDNLYLEQSLMISLGDIVRIKEYASGGWALVQRVEDGAGDILHNYRLVGRQGGTVEILKEPFVNNKIGYDALSSFDGALYDAYPATELRNIIRAVKNSIFVGDYAVEWNKLFFVCVRYAFTQQRNIDWAFKTSFISATHNVGELEQRVSFKNDNLDSFQKYVEEVKPYRTTIREFVSKYTKTNNSTVAVTDFDIPAVYSTQYGEILPANADFERFQEYPWKWWLDNNSYKVVDIKLANAGSGYTSPPTVIIESEFGSGASAVAYVANGSVSGIELRSQGNGYLSAPKVTLVGGNGNSADVATAVAVIGGSPVRSISTTIKFDRYTKLGNKSKFEYVEDFTASGYDSAFTLKYLPIKNKRKLRVFVNNVMVFRNEFSIVEVDYKTNENSIRRAQVILSEIPQEGDVVRVEYEISDQYLDAVNRINRYYEPNNGMLGKETNQLMSGIDFGGVQVQGTTFDVTGGWDAMPWFTDSWDSVEPNGDFYFTPRVYKQNGDNKVRSEIVSIPDELAQQELSFYVKRRGSLIELKTELDTQTNVVGQLPVIKGNQYQSGEITLLHSDNEVYVLESHVITSNGEVANFSANIEAGKVSLSVETVEPTTLIKLVRLAVTELRNLASGADIVLKGGLIGSDLTVLYIAGQKENVDTVSASLYQLVKYQVQLSCNSKYQCQEIIVAHDGTEVYSLEQNVIVTEDVLAEFDFALENNSLILQATPKFDHVVCKVVKTAVSSNPRDVGQSAVFISNTVVNTLTAEVGVTGQAVFDSVPTSQFTTLKYQFVAQNTAGIHAGELTLANTASGVYFLESGTIASVGNLVEFSAAVSDGVLEVFVSGATGTTICGIRTAVDTVADNLVTHNYTLTDADLGQVSALITTSQEQQEIDNFLASQYRSVKYLAQAVAGQVAIEDQSAAVITVVNPKTDERYYVNLGYGDLLVIRGPDSDGSVNITDPNLVDTHISGGDLSAFGNAYITAGGYKPEDVVISGSSFINSDHVPAPEEQVPGQVLESVSIKMFHSVPVATVPLQSSVYIADGFATKFDIGISFIEQSSVLVYVNKQLNVIDRDYTIDFYTNEVVFNEPVFKSSVIEIIAVGAGGSALTSYTEHIADGQTSMFRVNPGAGAINSAVVTCNGVLTTASIVDSQGLQYAQLGITPSAGQIVKIVALASNSTTTNYVRVNRQTSTVNSDLVVELDNFVDLHESSASSAVIATLGGRILNGADTVRQVYNGRNNVVKLGTDPRLGAGSVTFNDIEVYVNNQLKEAGVEYTFNANTLNLTVKKQFLTAGDEIKVLVFVNSEYRVNGTALELNRSAFDYDPSGQQLEVVWFSNYPACDIISDVYSGGRTFYDLKRKPIDSNYVWVYKNGQRLTKNKDFYADLNRNVVFINEEANRDDIFKIVEFGSHSWQPPVAVEMFKDMLNRNHYYRFAADLEVSLSQPLNYYDTEIVLTDASKLFEPNAKMNLAGCVLVNGERIEYLVKQGNTLSQLRRGCYGTSVGELYDAGALVVDVSRTEHLPYFEDQEKYVYDVNYSETDYCMIDRFTFIDSYEFELRSHMPAVISNANHIAVFVTDVVSETTQRVDSSNITVSKLQNKTTVTLSNLELTANNHVISVHSLMIGPFTSALLPAKQDNSWHRDTIPAEYGACNQVEVFVGGRRLNKNPAVLYDETLGESSPSSDRVVEAEFSITSLASIAPEDVNEQHYIRLTDPVASGQRIVVFKRVGRQWFPDSNESDPVISLHEQNNKIANFIFSKTTAVI